jgi:hypothetical protein
VLNGVVAWDGEDRGDYGEITVVDNRVFTSEDSGEILPSNNIRTELVLILEGEQSLNLEAEQKRLNG